MVFIGGMVPMYSFNKVLIFSILVFLSLSLTSSIGDLAFNNDGMKEVQLDRFVINNIDFLPLYAHGGGLNACGCHFNRKTGECHCHRDRGCGCECEPDRCKQ